MNFTKRICLLPLCFILSTGLFAQSKKPINVGVAPFEWNQRTADATYVSMIYDHISFLLSNNSAVTLVPRDESTWTEIQEERELLKTEPFILSETIQQGRSQGMEKLVSGKVYLTNVRPEGSGYSVSFSIYLAIVDVEGGVVEDNIMVSPRGVEDSDKIIEILKVIRKVRVLPRNTAINKLINFMELADVLAKYQVAGLTQDDSFKEALNQLDKSLIPFFDYHFGGKTNGYTPASGKRTSVIKSYNNVVSGDEEIRFPIVQELPGNRLRIYGGEIDGIKSNTKLDLVTEVEKTDITFNGDTIVGMEQQTWATLNFERLEGDFSIFAMPKKSDYDFMTVMNEKDGNASIHLIEANPLPRKAEEEEVKFSIVSIEGDRGLKIVGTAADGIKKNSKFSLVKEYLFNFTDLNGEKGSGIRREELTTFKFLEDRGDFQIIELENGETKTVDEILGRPAKGEKVYVLFKLKNY